VNSARHAGEVYAAAGSQLVIAPDDEVTLYNAQGCCLCDDAKRVLEAVRGRAAFELDEVDIDYRLPTSEAAYNDEVR